MNRLSVADRRHAAAAGGAAMDRDELAENIAGADLEAGRLALVFQVLRRQANRRIGKHLRAVADRGVPRSIADAPIVQWRPMRTSGPITANGPTLVPSPITASA